MTVGTHFFLPMQPTGANSSLTPTERHLFQRSYRAVAASWRSARAIPCLARTVSSFRTQTGTSEQHENECR